MICWKGVLCGVGGLASLMVPMQKMPAEISEVRMLLWIGCDSSGHMVCPLIPIWDESRRGAAANQTVVLLKEKVVEGMVRAILLNHPQEAEFLSQWHTPWRQSKLPADV